MVGSKLYVVGGEKGVVVICIWRRKKMEQWAGVYDGENRRWRVIVRDADVYCFRLGER